MAIKVTTEPIEMNIDGTTVFMQGDPSAGPHWGTLLDTPIAFSSQEQRDNMRTVLTEALAGMAETPEDAEALRGLDLGQVTLRKVATAYSEAVTGFPTQRSKRST